MSQRVWAWAPALLWAAVLFAFSSRSTLPGDLGGGLDKVVHFGAYAVLGVLLAYGAVQSRLPLRWPVLIGLAYAASDEIHQAFVPGRSPDVADWTAEQQRTQLAARAAELKARLEKGETLAAIAAELVGSVDVSEPEPLDSPDAGPEIFVSEVAAGRETLALEGCVAG